MKAQSGCKMWCLLLEKLQTDVPESFSLPYARQSTETLISADAKGCVMQTSIILANKATRRC